MFLTVFLLIGCALVAIAAVPLVLRLVPPNPVYGFRTERALDDAAYWFVINQFLGQALLIAVGLSALALIAWSGTWLKPAWLQFTAFLLPIIIAVGATFAYERKVAKR